jgi:hypothetical protein
MIGISDFFKRIQNSFSKEVFVRNIIKDCTKKHTSADIALVDISFQGSTVMLKNINQSARSTIFIKKHSIIKDENAAQSIRIISDIR